MKLGLFIFFVCLFLFLFLFLSFFLGSIPYISSTQAPETEAILSTHQCHDICPYQSIASLNKRLHKWQPARSVSYILQSTKTGCYSCHELVFSLCDIAVTALIMQNNEFINTKSKHGSCMSSSQSSSKPPSSSSSEVEELRARAVREQVDLYRQLREQLVNEVERYQREGNHKLASIISESLREQ